MLFRVASSDWGLYFSHLRGVLKRTIIPKLSLLLETVFATVRYGPSLICGRKSGDDKEISTAEEEERIEDKAN